MVCQQFLPLWYFVVQNTCLIMLTYPSPSTHVPRDPKGPRPQLRFSRSKTEWQFSFQKVCQGVLSGSLLMGAKKESLTGWREKLCCDAGSVALAGMWEARDGALEFP